MRFLFSPFCALLALAFSQSCLQARVFTDTRGRKIEASILGVKDGQVELKLKKSGKVYTVPVSKFSAADRAYIKRWQGSQKEAQKEDTGDERKKLPKLLAKAEPMELEGIVLDTGIWEKGIPDFEREHRQNGFRYMSASKRALRAPGKGFTLFGKKAGEVVIRSDAGKIAAINISIYNRGDDGGISMPSFEALYSNIVSKMTGKTGARASDASKTNTVKMVRKMWEWENSTVLLEKSLSSGGKTPEFLRIKMKAKNSRDGGMARRSSLRDNVVRDEASGDVCIADVPMIDQGRKGYCAVASAARVYRYYGLDVDQHELAQIAGTGPGSGTSLGEMVAALKRVTRHVHSRVLVLYEYPKGISKKSEDFDYGDYKGYLKEYRRDLKAYNKIARKRGEREFPESRGSLANPQLFRRTCKPAIYREVMTSKSGYPRACSRSLVCRRPAAATCA